MIVGGGAVDTITGGQGSDKSTGGGGADIFRFTNFSTAAGTGTLAEANTTPGIDRETITVTAGTNNADQGINIIFTVNGVSKQIIGNIDTLAGGVGIDTSDANALATFIAAQINADTATAATAATNVVTATGDNSANLTINSISFTGSTLPSAVIANGADTTHVRTVTIDVDPVVNETYSFSITSGGVTTNISATATTTTPQDLVNLLIADVNSKLGGVVVASDVAGVNVTQFTISDVNADNGGFGLTVGGVAVVSATGDTNVTVTGTSVTGFDKITDFNAGGADVIRIAAANDVAAAAATAAVAGVSVQIDANGKVTFAAADNTLDKAITALAADNTNVGNNKVVFFEMGGNSYVYGAGIDTTNAAADFLVELTGVVGLTKLTESAATAGDFTIA